MRIRCKQLFPAIQWALVVVIFVCLFGWLHSKSLTIPLDQDEIHTFYGTESYTLLWKKDFESPFWKFDVNFDHPPVSRYMYGYYLTTIYGDFTQIRDDLITRYGRWIFGQFETEDDFLRTPFSIYIYQMRYVSVILTWLTLILVCINFFLLTKSMFSIGIVFVLLNNDIFIKSMLKALPDASYIFFSMFALLAFILFLEYKSLGFLIISGIIGGLSFASKLTGITFFVVISAYFIIEYLITRKYFLKKIFYITIIWIIGFDIWLITNPTVYLHPIDNTLKYFLSRQEVMIGQILDPKNYTTVINSSYERAFASWAAIFNSADPSVRNITRSSFLNTVSFLLGFYFIIQKLFLKASIVERFVAIYIFVTFLYIYPFLQLTWYRYYLPLIIPVVIISYYGLFGLYESYFNKVVTTCKHIIKHRMQL